MSKTTDEEAKQVLLGFIHFISIATLAVFWIGVFFWLLAFVIQGWNDALFRGLIVLAVVRVLGYLFAHRAKSWAKQLKETAIIEAAHRGTKAA